MPQPCNHHHHRREMNWFLLPLLRLPSVSSRMALVAVSWIRMGRFFFEATTSTTTSLPLASGISRYTSTADRQYLLSSPLNIDNREKISTILSSFFAFSLLTCGLRNQAFVMENFFFSFLAEKKNLPSIIPNSFFECCTQREAEAFRS